MRISSFGKFIIAVGASELAGIIGSVFTAPSISTWYAGLVKPALNPPAWVFAPVWTTLFALMGIALWLAWSRRNIRIFAVQLALNVLWSFLFFGQHRPGWALIDIVLLLAAIIWTMVAFSKTSKAAAWFLAPYLLWVSFASYLNYALWALNR